MIGSGPLLIDENLGASTRAVFDSAQGVEGAVAYLRCAGEGKLGSIRVLVKACGMPLATAKQVVHMSSTWADSREIDDALHDSISEAVSSLQKETDEGRVSLRKAS